MAVIIRIDGIEVVCDTPAEATQMVAALRSPQPAAPAASPRQHQLSATAQRPSSPAPASFEDFWGELEYVQRQFVRVIAEASPGPVVSESLATALDVDANQVGWVKRKMNVLAHRLSFDIDNYLEHGKEQVGNSIKTSYRATRKLIESLAKLDGKVNDDRIYDARNGG